MTKANRLKNILTLLVLLTVSTMAMAEVDDLPNIEGQYSGWDTKILKMGTHEDEFKKVCSSFSIKNYAGSDKFEVIALNYTDAEIRSAEEIRKIPFRIWNFYPLSKKIYLNANTKQYIYKHKGISYDTFGFPSTRFNTMLSLTVSSDQLIKFEYSHSIGSYLSLFKTKTHFICTKP